MDGINHIKHIFKNINFDLLYNEIKNQLQRQKKYIHYCVQANIIDNTMPIYRINLGINHRTYSFTPLIQQIVDNAKQFDINTNLIKIMLYLNGHGEIQKHSDPCVDVKIGSKFAIVSLGATRTFVVGDKITNKLVEYKFEHGDIIIIDYDANKKYFHSLKLEEHIVEPRICLVLKEIDTFVKDDHVFGLGSPYKTFEEAKQHPLIDNTSNLKLGIELAELYKKQQALTNWNYDELYGKGFPFQFMNPFIQKD